MASRQKTNSIATDEKDELLINCIRVVIDKWKSSPLGSKILGRPTAKLAVDGMMVSTEIENPIEHIKFWGESIEELPITLRTYRTTGNTLHLYLNVREFEKQTKFETVVSTLAFLMAGILTIASTGIAFMCYYSR